MMSEVRCIAQEELIDTLIIGKEATNPTRKLKVCTCKGPYGYEQEHAVIAEVIGKKFALFTSKLEGDVWEFFNYCLDVIPCFWSPKVPSHSHLAEIFCEQVLTKLVELMRLYGNSWSVAHMCVSLPLPEDTMMILLASDSFKDHFTSTHHPKKYRLLHLAVEMESLPACRAIMRCSDQWLHEDPGLFVEDIEGVTPINRAAIAHAWACADYLQQSQCLVHEAAPQQPRLSKAPHKLTQGGVPFHSFSYARSRQQVGIDTQLHDLVMKKFPNALLVEKQRQLVKLLTNCDPNGLNADGTTPLHLAVQAGDVHSVKALIAFDADAQVVNNYGETSLDLAKRFGFQEISDLLVLSCHSATPVQTPSVVHTGYTTRGERVLCLDGGGIKGLILIDMLSTIEKITGKRIVDLFDWIIGTSTGGILALALVYTDLPLNEIRRLYFELKNDVFVEKIGGVLLPDQQTEVLEGILKRIVGEQTKLGSKTHPKVLISATDMDTTPLRLVFFNNFENGTHGKDQLVWVAGRATSAAPFYFKQCGSYADGGLKANNPSMSGLTRIHEYYTELGWRDYKIGCVVSLGCGMFRKKIAPIEAKIRENIPKVVHLNDIPDHVCNLRLITACQTAKQGYDGIKQLGSPATSFLFDVMLAEICECDDEPVRHTKAFCERDRTPFIRLSPELDIPIELDENSDEKLVDMLITTKWYIQAQIDHFRRIKTLTES